MGYTKIIQSGDLIEKYEYERNPPVHLPRDNKRGRVAPFGYDQLTEEERADRLHKRRVSSVNRCRQSFFRLVRANLSKTPPIMLAFTMLDILDLRISYACFHAFGQRLRRAFGKDIAWIAVPEFQERGAVHFHVLMWNLPYEIAKTETEGSTRRIQNLWRAGYVDCIQTDGSPKLATYLAKYMSKAMSDSRLLGKKSYSASRNVLRPVSLNTPTTIDLACEVWGIDGSTQPIYEREYYTKWMGKCRHRNYSLQDMTETEERVTISP